jgi:hypothetical protein
MTESQEPALAAANAFVEHLAELPLATWLAIGRAATTTDAGSSERAALWERVEDAIVHQRLDLAAWSVRDAVETVVHLTNHAAGRLSRADRRLLAAAHGAVEDAALAILVAECLPWADIAQLCAPFADHVPLIGPRLHEPAVSRGRKAARA